MVKPAPPPSITVVFQINEYFVDVCVYEIGIQCVPGSYACATNPKTGASGWATCDNTGRYVVSLLKYQSVFVAFTTANGPLLEDTQADKHFYSTPAIVRLLQLVACLAPQFLSAGRSASSQQRLSIDSNHWGFTQT